MLFNYNYIILSVEHERASETLVIMIRKEEFHQRAVAFTNRKWNSQVRNRT